ncbi:MAG: class I SAM-dependent methyltransferase [Chloroflexota bacterium]
MRQNALTRRLLTPFKHTPFHPQWFVYKDEHTSLQEIGRQAHGLVLDIGAGAQVVQKSLSADCRYISLDYYQTAVAWYHTRPHLYGDGQWLPIKSGSVDTVLLLDVLEHLPQPEVCVAEIGRVLRSGGKLVLQVPFLYPLHDAPYDFHRWTIHGLRALADRYGFAIESELISGHPLETAALLTNLALSKTVLNWFRQKNPLLIFALLLLWMVPLVNLRGWLLARASGTETFMPQSYRVVWTKVP